MRWYVRQDHETYGPFDRGRIDEQIKDGRLKSDAMICEEGAKEWLPVSTLDTKKTKTPEKGESADVAPVKEDEPGAQPKRRSPPTAGPWLIVAACGAALTAIAGGVLVWRVLVRR